MSANAALLSLPGGRPEAAAGAALSAHSLRNDAVVIGPLLPDDTAAMFLWLNDVDAAEADMPFRPLDFMGYHNWLGEVSRNASLVLFAIRRQRHPAIIGYIALSKINAVHRSAELGVRIGADEMRGKGYGRAAITLALRYAWNQLNLNRVCLTVLAGNGRAIAAYRAAGFQQEGVLRQAAFMNGAWCDVIQMGILRPADASGMPAR